jgi:hypothetical protein
VATKSVNAKGNDIKITGTPNKRGKQILFSPKKRESPQGGTSTSQDDESAQLQTQTQPPKRLGTLLAIKDRSIVELLCKRKAPPNTRASGDNGVGGAYSKEQHDPGNGIVVDTPMATAASTLLYQLQYAGGDSLTIWRHQMAKGLLISQALWICAHLHLLTTTWTTSLMNLSFQMTKISSSTSFMIRRKNNYDHHSQRTKCI